MEGTQVVPLGPSALPLLVHGFNDLNQTTFRSYMSVFNGIFKMKPSVFIKTTSAIITNDHR